MSGVMSSPSAEGCRLFIREHSSTKTNAQISDVDRFADLKVEPPFNWVDKYTEPGDMYWERGDY